MNVNFLILILFFISTTVTTAARLPPASLIDKEEEDDGDPKSADGDTGILKEHVEPLGDKGNPHHSAYLDSIRLIYFVIEKRRVIFFYILQMRPL